MARINWSKVLGCGVLTGAATCAFGVVVFIARLWFGDFEGALSGLGRPRILPPGPATAFVMLALYLMMGIVIIWLYASLRPSYGAGPKTAAIAGIAVWLIVTLTELVLAVLGVLPLRTLLLPVATLFFGIVAGTELGAASYKD